MILEISKHIILDENHPKLPDWIFSRDNIILAQQIKLDENHMHEFFIFLKRWSKEFNESNLRISIVDFSDIILKYH